MFERVVRVRVFILRMRLCTYMHSVFVVHMRVRAQVFARLYVFPVSLLQHVAPPVLSSPCSRSVSMSHQQSNLYARLFRELSWNRGRLSTLSLPLLPGCCPCRTLSNPSSYVPALAKSPWPVRGSDSIELVLLEHG